MCGPNRFLALAGVLFSPCLDNARQSIADLSDPSFYQNLKRDHLFTLVLGQFISFSPSYSIINDLSKICPSLSNSDMASFASTASAISDLGFNNHCRGSKYKALVSTSTCQYSYSSRATAQSCTVLGKCTPAMANSLNPISLTAVTVPTFGGEAVCSYLLQADPISTPTSGTFFREDLVMKIFLWPFFLFR